METREQGSPLRMFGALVGFLMIAMGAVVVPTQPAQATGACSTTGATSAYGGGAGTSGDPYLISTPQQLALLSGTSGDWGRHYKQTANIDLGGCQWTTIGTSSTRFTGSYDGNGFQISGLSIGDQAGTSAGLFGEVGGVSLSNLRLSGAMNSNDPFVGGLVGKVVGTSGSRATISKIKVDMDITYRDGNYAGGIVGQADYLTVRYSAFLGDFVAASGDTAGIAAWGSFLRIEDSYARVTFSGTSSRQSGISGWNSATVARSFSASTGGDNGVSEMGLTAENVFWDSTIGPLVATSNGAVAGATGLSTTDMKTLGTYSAASWGIVDGWQPFDAASSKIWGICSGVNDGYPFLLWEYNSNPCPSASSNSGGGEEARSLAPAIHLDVKAKVGDLISGKPVEIAGTGLGSGSTYSLVVRSTPTTLDSGSANGSGAFENTVRMPTLSAGTHSVTLAAVASNGSTLSLVQTFTVSSTGVITSISDPAGSVTSSLAATGANSQSAMWGFGIAMALIAAGVFVRAVRRSNAPAV